MSNLTLKIIIALTLILATISSVAQTDSLMVKTEKSLGGGVFSDIAQETTSLSNYFSASNIIVSIIILVLSYLFLRIVSFALTVWAERNIKNRVAIKGSIPLVRIVVWTISITFILVAVFKPPMASILAFSASIGVAVGFAAQDLLKNIFGGIVIIFDKPFQIGDKVQVGNYYGEVVGIGLRSTRLVTNDDNLVSVPNLEIMNAAVANANSGEENCQVVCDIYLPLNCDINKVRSFAIESAQVSKHIYLNKAIVVLFFQEKIGSKVLMKVKVKAYVNDIRNEFAFKSEITEVLTNEFSELYESINQF